MDSEEFNEAFGEFDENKIALDEIAGMVVPIFKAFVTRGLSVQEAAALTAAMVSQGMPQPPQKPMED